MIRIATFTLLILVLASASEAAESSTTTSTATGAAVAGAEKTRPVGGPLIELTPRDGSVFTAYLLSMKDGTLALQLQGGDMKEAKTSDFATLRFIPPAPAPVPQTPPPAKPPVPTAAATGTSTGTQTAVAHELNPTEVKRREEHKRFMELTKKWRQGTKLTTAEEQELNDLREKLPMLRVVGGAAFIRQMVSAEEDAKTAAATGKLDPYILKCRVWLKEASTDNEARIQVLRLAYAYRQQNTPLVKMVEQLDKDIDAITRDPLRTTAREKLQNFIDLLYLLNGERAPRN